MSPSLYQRRHFEYLGKYLDYIRRRRSTSWDQLFNCKIRETQDQFLAYECATIRQISIEKFACCSISVHAECSLTAGSLLASFRTLFRLTSFLTDFNSTNQRPLPRRKASFAGHQRRIKLRLSKGFKKQTVAGRNATLQRYTGTIFPGLTPARQKMATFGFPPEGCQKNFPFSFFEIFSKFPL